MRDTNRCDAGELYKFSLITNYMPAYQILLLNGPNLNLLGTREPAFYGGSTLEEVVKRLVDLATEQGAKLTSFQSNAEHELIERVHAAPKGKN